MLICGDAVLTDVGGGGGVNWIGSRDVDETECAPNPHSAETLGLSFSAGPKDECSFVSLSENAPSEMMGKQLQLLQIDVKTKNTHSP